MQQKDICRITFITHYGPEKSMKMSVPISLLWWIKTITQLIYGQFTQTTPVFLFIPPPHQSAVGSAPSSAQIWQHTARITQLAFTYQNRGPKNTDLPDNTKRWGGGWAGWHCQKGRGDWTLSAFFFLLFFFNKMEALSLEVGERWIRENAGADRFQKYAIEWADCRLQMDPGEQGC